MPELPEAEIVARQIRNRLVGAVLTDAWIGREDIVREGLPLLSWFQGASLRTVDRYGKSVAMGFHKEGTVRFIVAELGMTGLLLFRSAQARHPQHVHVRVSFIGGDEPELCYWNPRRFGRISLFDRAGLNRYIARRFGLDPLSASREDFLGIVRQRRGRLKALLMHQQSVAGIGNIYANEILFRAGLHPDVRASRLSMHTVEHLYDLTQAVLQDAIRCGGSSVRDFFAPDGTEGQYKQRHLVYGKEGLSCPNKCGGTIRRLHGERSSFICPSCQTKRLRNRSAARIEKTIPQFL
ncbi:DNA-formamidopyrimidine glycosylase and DNA-(Apurinic or apyrimidinic site) lyase [Nitrospira sp. KM1]|uniref:bifunctional DNA-formamidopyrimidine glycosylase/DNA-(apurinic or apyrimidinic site) lyase n=1 Tax=Nitrospira sp. KM1 TaxID=1936990 RepID=UPI0013A74C6D|nr:bifunctional DNA-formamidopyrimidine glycosylase/DNA-(apurinic or apyrimidinic site) lyase [Nitrospira sp. KM1]BCA55889.1 DNA-formamidopyrimidine glycosylase and DNA-(Apurinic or apyrimidinic site) lyase [Nitrospira sp. KM1]